jgi:predicted component of type VI protein secretion system
MVTMGRHRDNDLVVDDTLASRVHARIEYRRGKYFLIDQSTNGTHIITEGEEGVCLRREELQLNGSGMICLGRPLDEDSPLAIHFSLES